MPSYFLKADIKNYQPQHISEVTWMITNYGINDNLKLFRSFAPRPMSGAFMGVDDKYCKNVSLLAKNLTSHSLILSLCNSIIKEAQYCKFSGIYLSFTHSCDATLLAETLVKRMPQNLSLFIGAQHLSHFVGRCILVFSPGFDRGFASQLSSFCDKNRGQQLGIDLGPEAILFNLPDIEQNPTHLSAQFASKMCMEKGSAIFYDKVHLCRYATFMQDGKPSVCLFDTDQTFLEKIYLVESTPEISSVIINYATTTPLFDPYLRNLFSYIQK